MMAHVNENSDLYTTDERGELDLLISGIQIRKEGCGEHGYIGVLIEHWVVLSMDTLAQFHPPPTSLFVLPRRKDKD